MNTHIPTTYILSVNDICYVCFIYIHLSSSLFVYESFEIKLRHSAFIKILMHITPKNTTFFFYITKPLSHLRKFKFPLTSSNECLY